MLNDDSSGSTAVVMDGGAGIGRAVAEACAAAGGRGAVLDVKAGRSPEQPGSIPS